MYEQVMYNEDGSAIVSNDKGKIEIFDATDNLEEILKYKNLIEKLESEYVILVKQMNSNIRKKERSKADLKLRIIGYFTSLALFSILLICLFGNANFIEINSIFGPIQAGVLLEYVGCGLFTGMYGILSLENIVGYRKAKRNIEAIKETGFKLTELIKENKEHLDELYKNQKNDNNVKNVKTDVKTIDNLELDINYKKYLEMFREICINIKKYNKYMKKGILQEKLSDKYSATELEIIEKTINEVGPKLIKNNN